MHGAGRYRGSVQFDEIREALLNDAFDQALVYHGFTDYMRDYELVLQLSSDPHLGVPPEFKRYVFVNCVSANVTSALSPDVWSRSLHDRLTDDDYSDNLDGYVWGVRWQQTYPGFTFATDSAEAERWRMALGLPFYDLRLEANGHNLQLVFSDLRIEPASRGYAPFTVREPLWDGKIPLQ